MNTTKPVSPTSGLTRRHFLRKSSTAVAGGLALSQLPIARFAHAAGSDTLKLAMIGCGGRGSGATDQALSVKPSVKLVAVADVHPDRMETSLRNLTKRHPDKVDVSEANKFIGFNAYKEAIKLADVVVLATPPGFRPAHFEEAVRQGKHIFSEKPVAVDAPGVRRFLAAVEEAKRKNLKVGIGLQRRHQDGYLETIKRLHDGQIGDIVAARCYWNGNSPWVRTRAELETAAGRKLTEMEYQMRNWYYFNWLCGDHIVEQHIHNIDVINWVKGGYPVRAQGMGGRQVRVGPDFGEIFDHHAVEFEYADGSRCFSFCRHQQGCWNSVTEHVVGTKGSADISGHIIRGETPWKFRGDTARRNAYQQEHDDLFDAILNNKPYNEGEYGAKSTMTAILGRMATYSGKMIEWDEALNSKIDLMPAQYAWDANPPVLPGPDGLYPCAIPGKTAVI